MPDAATSRPPTVRREDLVEDLHGHAVADPYRWLEAPADDPDVRAFVVAQNEHTAAHLGTLPARERLRARLAALWSRPRHGAPWREAGWWFQLRNDGTQDQDAVWCAAADPDDLDVAPDESGEDGEGGAWRCLLDPNTWSEDGTASLTGLAVSRDGARVAFARSDAGSDWMTWRVCDTATGEVHPDEVPWSRFSGATWLPDGRGFLYGAYPAPEAGEEHAAAVRGQELRLHLVGTDAAEDRVVHARPDQPEWGFSSRISHDGRWLLLEVWRGTDPTTRVHVAEVVDGEIGEVRPLLDDADAHHEVLGVVGDEVVLLSDLDAPLGRVLAADLRTAALREVLAERDDPLLGARLVGGADDATPAWLACRWLHHATARLTVHDARTGRHLHDVALPGSATVTAVTGGRHDRVVHLAIQTFAAPSTRVRHHLATGETVTLPAAPGADPLDLDEVVVDQVRVHHDGVAVPLFLLHRPDVRPDGARPTVLWGYGGFRIPITPMYQPAWRAWVEAGGVLAVACLRGGGEYGRAWHDDGRLDAKEHVFDDALACAAWLTGRRRDEVTATALTDATDPDAVWTAPGHLGVEGRSNGGLLAAACLTREPSAFGSVVPEVGVLDLVRFHRFTIGWAWTSDYGDPDDPDDLAVVLRYSPYHRLEDGTSYPPTLLTTGDTDDRVVPAHSYKFGAALQAAQGGSAPVLLRVDTSAGHGAGKPVSKQVEERADVLAFHAHHLGLEVPDAAGTGGEEPGAAGTGGEDAAAG